MLRIINLSKSYNNQLILGDINLAVKNGEVVTIVGKSGSGKSTLLRIIAGLELPMKGKIKLQNKTVNDGNTFINPEKKKLFSGFSRLCFVSKFNRRGKYIFR